MNKIFLTTWLTCFLALWNPWITNAQQHAKKQIVTTISDQEKNILLDIENTLNNTTPEHIKKLFWKYAVSQNLDKYNEKVYKFLKKIQKHLTLNNSEYLIYVDKSVQKLFVIHFDWKNFNLLWYDKISTWNPKKSKKHSETPNLIINRSLLLKKDRRAEWTWTAWFGKKDSKVFFLGEYYQTKLADNISLTPDKWLWVNIHLASHCTNQTWLANLWKKMSQWCIRLSIFLNILLDKLSLLNNRWKYFIIWEAVEKDDFPLRKTDTQNIEKIL